MNTSYVFVYMCLCVNNDEEADGFTSDYNIQDSSDVLPNLFFIQR